jgi:phage tail-like protein
MSSAAALLPAVPSPPHDPLAIVLDARAGWRLAGTSTGVEIAPLDCALALAPPPGGARALADDDGSFGGLVLPDNVAIGPEGIVLLLDRNRLVLKRFDPCSCAFVVVPCIAGAGSGARQLAQPGGMVASCGNLYVCDTGNRRVQVFALRGLVLRAIWPSPPAASLPTPWRPVAVAADALGYIYVGDPDNGYVHVFGPGGRWLRALVGLGAIVHLTTDCGGRLYVQTGGSADVLVVDPQKWPATGQALERQSRADEVADRFAPLPFPITPDGHLQLGALCAAAGAALPDGNGEFDGSGAPVAASPALMPSFQPQGSVTTVALDSRLHRCVWDRVQLEGVFPDATSVRVFVYTDETELPDALVAMLPDDAWSACPPLTGLAGNGNRWDAMLRAPAGRYLWLRLVLAGDGHATPRVCKVKLDFPRISLRRYLPATFGSDELAAEFTDRLLAIFDRELRHIESTIDWQARFYDPLSSPADDADRRRDFLSWLATWIGVTLDRSWPLARRRRYLKQVGKLFPQRGTLEGLRRHLQLYLGLPADDDCTEPPRCGPCTTKKPARWRPPALVLEHYRLRRWLFVGRGRLGEQARLWGESIVNRSRLGGAGGPGTARIGVTQLDTVQDPLRDPFWVYAHKFTVFAPASVARSAGARRGLERLIRSERPAHTAFQVVYVEPRFRIGIQSMIGFDSAIGAYPDGGIKLHEARLGKATVLGGDDPSAPSLSVGRNARIGTTTRLT